MKEAEKGRAKVPASVPMPHDRGYKKSLSNPREFLHFIQKYIGEDWMGDLTEDRLSLCDKEFVENDYEGREADLLYKATVQNGREVFIYILQELQSYVDYTMIFRILIYVTNTLLRHFLGTSKEKRERADFRLPAVVPVVFYNGENNWTAVSSLEEYQVGGGIFGRHVLNLEYYLINLQEIGEEYILSTNTVIDNIMYCDKFRRKHELMWAVRKAFGRVSKLEAQEREEFHCWARHILLSICEDKEMVEVIFDQMEKRKEGDDMAFEYTIIREHKKERERILREGMKEGMKEAIIELLEDCGDVLEELKREILAQSDLGVLKKWHKLAASASTPKEFWEKAKYEMPESNS